MHLSPVRGGVNGGSHALLSLSHYLTCVAALMCVAHVWCMAASAAPTDECPTGTITADRTISATSGLEPFIGPGCAVTNAQLTFSNSVGSAAAPLTTVFSVTIVGAAFQKGRLVFASNPNGEYWRVNITGNTFTGTDLPTSYTFITANNAAPWAAFTLTNNTFDAALLSGAFYSWYSFQLRLLQREQSAGASQDIAVLIARNMMKGRVACLLEVVHRTNAPSTSQTATVVIEDNTMAGPNLAASTSGLYLQVILPGANVAFLASTSAASYVTVQRNVFEYFELSMTTVASVVLVEGNRKTDRQTVLTHTGHAGGSFRFVNNNISMPSTSYFLLAANLLTNQQLFEVARNQIVGIALRINPNLNPTSAVGGLPAIRVIENTFSSLTTAAVFFDTSSSSTFNAPYYLIITLKGNRFNSTTTGVTRALTSYSTAKGPVCILSSGNVALDRALCGAPTAPDPTKRCYDYVSIRNLSTACYPTRTVSVSARTPTPSHTRPMPSSSATTTLTLVASASLPLTATHDPEATATRTPTTYVSASALVTLPTTLSATSTTSSSASPSATMAATRSNEDRLTMTPTGRSTDTFNDPATRSRTPPPPIASLLATTQTTTTATTDVPPATTAAMTMNRFDNTTTTTTGSTTTTAAVAATTPATTATTDVRPSTSSAMTTRSHPTATNSTDTNNNAASGGATTAATIADHGAGFVPPLVLVAAAMLVVLWAGRVGITSHHAGGAAPAASMGLFGLQLLALGMVVPCGSGVGSRWLLRVLLAPLDIGGSPSTHFGRLAGSAVLAAGTAIFGASVIAILRITQKQTLFASTSAQAVALALLELLLPGVVHEACLLLFGYGAGLSTGERVCGALVLVLCALVMGTVFVVLPVRRMRTIRHKQTTRLSEPAMALQPEGPQGARKEPAPPPPPLTAEHARWTTPSERAGAVPVVGRLVAPRWTMLASDRPASDGLVCPWVTETALSARSGPIAAAALATHGVLITTTAAVISAASFGASASSCEGVAAAVGVFCLVHAVTMAAVRGLRTVAADVLVPAQSLFAGLAILSQLGPTPKAPEGLAVLVVVSALGAAAAAGACTFWAEPAICSKQAAQDLPQRCPNVLQNTTSA